MVYSIDETLDYVVFLAKRIPDGNVTYATLMLLLDLSFPSHMDSFEPIQKAIVLKIQNPNLQMFEIYLEVARYFKIDAKAVEIGIRSSISCAWKHGSFVKWSYFFPNHISKGKQPTNKEFISQIAYVIRLWSICNKEVHYVKK